MRFLIPLLVFLTSCLAQEPLSIRILSKQKSPMDAQKVYLSACSAVQREFGASQVLRPQLTLVIGGHGNAVDWDRREIHFQKWDANLFAQGVVMLAFEELLPVQRRLAVAKRAVTWADSTVEVRNVVDSTAITGRKLRGHHHGTFQLAGSAKQHEVRRQSNAICESRTGTRFARF